VHAKKSSTYFASIFKLISSIQQLLSGFAYIDSASLKNPMSVSVIFFLCLSFSSLIFSSLALRVPGSPFPVCSQGLNSTKTLYVLRLDGMSGDDEFTALTLQGIFSRKGPQIYRYSNGNDYQLWLNVTKDVFDVTLNTTFETSLSGMLSFFRPQLSGGYALVNIGGKDNSTSVAIAAAAAAGVIAVTTVNEGMAVAAGYTMKFDLRGWSVEKAISVFNNTDSGQGFFTFSKTVNTIQDPSKYCMGDYSIATSALQWWVPDVPSSSLAPVVFGAMSSPFATLGWGPDELNTVRAASSYGGGVVASDWAINVDVLSNFDIPSFTQKTVPTPLMKEDYNDASSDAPAHTVCFVMSDGDNLQWVLGGFASDTAHFGSPDRGKVPMGWTLSPSIADLSPATLLYLYNAANDGTNSSLPGRDVFVAGVSGVSYSYPDVMLNQNSLDASTELTAAYMAKAGLRIANVMSYYNNVDDHVAISYLKHSEIDALLWYYFSDYAGVSGAIRFVQNKPVIGARFNLWGSGVAPDPTDPHFKNVSALADALRFMPATPDTSFGYSLVALHAWSHNVTDAVEVVRLANQRGGTRVEAVDPQEFVRRILGNITH